MCSRVWWPDNAAARVAARTLDWAEPDDPRLWALPRGAARHGGTGHGALTWTARYGSLAMSGFGIATTEAVNEAGLAAHILYLAQTSYEPADGRPTVSNARWVQWLADTCGSVTEALAAMEQARIVSVPVRGQHLGGHLALEDASGDSAIVEMLEGRRVVYHGAQAAVLTNDPPLREQLANRARYRSFGGQLPVPGDILSTDRFVRASYFLKHLPPAASAQEAVAGAVLVSRSVWVPPGAPYDDFSVYPTWWASAVDVTSRTYYFQTVRSPNLVWVGLNDLDLTAGTPATALDPCAAGLQGDLSGQFAPAGLS